MDGLGLAMPIENGRGINFLGAAFTHATTVCITHYKRTGLIKWDNNSDVFIFAWGETGGAKTARAAKANARRARNDDTIGRQARK